MLRELLTVAPIVDWAFATPAWIPVMPMLAARAHSVTAMILFFKHIGRLF